LGGSIQPNNVKIREIKPKIQQNDEEDVKHNWMAILKRLASAERPPHAFQMTQFRDDLSNYKWRNEIPYYQHNNWYEKHSEDGLYKGALPLFSGNGAAGDHPDTHRFFMESFQEHPELLQAYTRGTTKHKPDTPNHVKAFAAAPHLFIPHTQIK
jgi:hypothetical protein